MKSNKIIILRFKVLNIVEYRRIRVQYPLRPPRYSREKRKVKKLSFQKQTKTKKNENKCKKSRQKDIKNFGNF